MRPETREGWVALHANRLEPAARALDGIGRDRARRELAILHEDLARLGHLAWQRTFTEWEARSGLPEGSAIPFVAALDATDAGDAEAAGAWTAKAGRARTPPFAAGRPLPQGLDASGTPTEPASTCLRLHEEVRRSGRIDELGTCGTAPLFEGTEAWPTLYDPLVYRTLAIAWGLGSASPSPADPLVGLLFGPFWSEADREAGLAADPTGALAPAFGPTLASFGLPSDPPPADDPQWARERIRLLDQALDAWNTEQAATASPEGRDLLANLELVAGYRSKVLLAWARSALRADRPHEALATAQLALDVEHGREVGPGNPPALFAVLAEANLRTGRTREALDALRPLLEPYPHVHGLSETVGDLAILEGLGRQGDSKEH